MDINLPNHGLPRRNESEISESIRYCATKCMGHADPRACAEAYAIALIADGWTADDAREVQDGALGVLAKLTGDRSLIPDRKNPYD